MMNPVRRHILAVLAGACGVMSAVLVPIITVQNAPLVIHADCKFPFSTVGYCKHITHNVTGWYLVAMFAGLIGGIVTVIAAAAIDAIISSHPQSNVR